MIRTSHYLSCTILIGGYKEKISIATKDWTSREVDCIPLQEWDLIQAAEAKLTVAGEDSQVHQIEGEEMIQEGN